MQGSRPISGAEDAEAYVAMVCFKHGPPERMGVELEWTVHHRDDQDRPLDPRLLAEALGNHAPPALPPHSTHEPLPRGSLVTVEPGGQVEISSLPSPTPGALVAAVDGDIAALDSCPPFTHPLRHERDLVTSWVERVMAAPVMCVGRACGHWSLQRPMSFVSWVSGTGERRPSYDDLDYHLSTIFPPVRPRGYVEVRYLDTQPPGSWQHPLLVLDALLSSRRLSERACELTEHCADLWLTAARRGLADHTLRRAARDLVELVPDHLDATFPLGARADVVKTLLRRTVAARRQPA